ncbi:hypothetical protein [Ureaplasma ceti]|uniref:Uncharacterized protein n=1 Tax=Ureaplasma ceti TaxID=3119530 RepID=A0ABP9U5M6_9BACT
MTYYVIPLFKNKLENEFIFNQIKTNMNEFDNDDFILGMYPILDVDAFANQMILNCSAIGLKNITLPREASFKTQFSAWLKAVVNSSLTKVEKISAIVSFLHLFGLTIKPIEHEHEMINEMLMDINVSPSDDVNFWLENVILLNGFYNAFTNKPFNDFDVKNYFSTESFLKLFNFFIKIF